MQDILGLFFPFTIYNQHFFLPTDSFFASFHFHLVTLNKPFCIHRLTQGLTNNVLQESIFWN